MKNIGIIDRLFRLVGLHMCISLVDISLFNAPTYLSILSLIAIYLLITMLIGVDPIYKMIGLNTLENLLS